MEKKTTEKPTNLALIVAGGKGMRMKSGIKKQYLSLDGVPVLVRTLKAFDSHPRVDGIILVVPETDIAFCRNSLITPAGLTLPLHLVKGGITRQDSVSNGLSKAASLSAHRDSTFVLVHDGVRPFVDPALVDACLSMAEKTGACIPALEISDTIKKVGKGNRICQTLDRSVLFRAQTPQVFRLDLICSAVSKACASNFMGTDEASVLENAGIPVYTVPGDPCNIKLTTPGDLAEAEFILEKKAGGLSQ